MIIDGNYIFRKGKKGDRTAPGYISPIPPDFVLEYNGQQIGAAHGDDDCLIRHIGIHKNVAQYNMGHCTKFIELWESYGEKKRL